MTHTGAQFSPEGKYIYLLSDGGNIFKIDALTGDSLSKFSNSIESPVGRAINFELSENGSYISIIDGSPKAFLWDVKQEKAIKCFSEYYEKDPSGKLITLKTATGITVSTDENKALLAYHEHIDIDTYLSYILEYDIKNDKEIQKIPFNYGYLAQIKYSHNGLYFITNSIKNTPNQQDYKSYLILWDAKTFQQVKILAEFDGQIGYDYIKFSPNDEYIGVSSTPVIWIYEIKTGNTILNTLDNRIYYNFAFLVDNFHYLLYAKDKNQKRYIELYNFNGNKIKEYNGWGSKLESSSSLDNNLIFYSNGVDATVLKVLPSTYVDPSNSKEPLKIITENGIIFLEIQEFISQNISVLISDLLGKKYYQENINHQLGQTRVELNADLSSGIYLCKVIADQKEYCQKIEIVR
jgi:WD40 repeat protein